MRAESPGQRNVELTPYRARHWKREGIYNMADSMTKADQVRAILATEPDLTHEQIAIQVGCSRRWVSAIARAMRPPPAETDLEGRVRALEQWRKDITEHLKRYENRPIATLNDTAFAPSRRQRLRIQ